MEDRILRISRESGKPIRAGGRTLIPQVQTVRLKLPSFNAGMLWNRPYAVLVKNADGEETTLPVVDVTRAAQVMILLVGVLTITIIWFLRRSNNE